MKIYDTPFKRYQTSQLIASCRSLISDNVNIECIITYNLLDFSFEREHLMPRNRVREKLRRYYEDG